ncbi:hypothetical protein F511_46705 [Dorcoceras hygrometricum]|uniref:Uncharacterized protein n=1 Tax=Dorcoceras hygrometricum TaxID=472368 RepID=A0A2Z7A070_9LAMI|nr:hypothetical protein F511_46705 [Dorcoceras hygrometricum]
MGARSRQEAPLLVRPGRASCGRPRAASLAQALQGGARPMPHLMRRACGCCRTRFRGGGRRPVTLRRCCDG